ncbi:MAG: HAD family phosphatase [Candidatus Micrarchaeota archaeon]|nr:HAD family phosphatase [Candidatus Micrarchaeota archaeon]MDE1847711.1 HAD family phosphatase [Candidatus Micrarchaeota archaeon]MDE1864140.1 HAD family phosphatase [Candidatus Micrarchaeota archaeon]
MRTIILLDIDGTLVDAGYKVNSDSIFESIKTLESKGAIFSLNSNRSLEDLMPIYEKFGLNGFIIGENGAFSVIPGQQLESYANNEEIATLAQRIPEMLKSKFPSSEFLVRDTVAFLQNPEKSDAMILFVSNKFRKYTMSVFVGRVEDAKFVTDLELLKRVAGAIATEVSSLGADFDVVASPINGNVLINPKSCSKSSTLSRVIEVKYAGYEVIMISDDESDEMIGSVGKFYTLSNAKERIKEKADYVSRYSYAMGVDDILNNRILK